MDLEPPSLAGVNRMLHHDDALVASLVLFEQQQMQRFLNDEWAFKVPPIAKHMIQVLANTSALLTSIIITKYRHSPSGSKEQFTVYP
jgi:hypothetical protein